MLKYKLISALFSVLFIAQNSISCPCNASPSDKRPFFEQYEPDNPETQEETTDDTDIKKEVKKS